MAESAKLRRYWLHTHLSRANAREGEFEVFSVGDKRCNGQAGVIRAKRRGVKPEVG